MLNEIVLTCDLGGTNLRLAAVNSEGKILHRIKAETPNTGKAEEVIRAIVQNADKCRETVKGKGEVKAFSAAVPATINTKDGIILKAPNLTCLNGFRFTKKVSKKLNLPVFLENDANAAAIGEQSFGAARGFQNVVIVTLGTGVGGGIIINGEILRGVDGTAGEIGHICVEPFGAQCGCGSRGCVEQYASAAAIVRIVEAIKSQYPRSILQNKNHLNAKDVYNAGIQNDALALDAFNQMGFYLGIALADLVNVLNPEAIVIGGGVSAGWNLFNRQVKEQIQQRAFREPARRVKILRAGLGDDAGILGAAHQAFDLSKI